MGTNNNNKAFIDCFLDLFWGSNTNVIYILKNLLRWIMWYLLLWIAQIRRVLPYSCNSIERRGAIIGITESNNYLLMVCPYVTQINRMIDYLDAILVYCHPQYRNIWKTHGKLLTSDTSERNKYFMICLRDIPFYTNQNKMGRIKWHLSCWGNNIKNPLRNKVVQWWYLSSMVMQDMENAL